MTGGDTQPRLALNLNIVWRMVWPHIATHLGIPAKTASGTAAKAAAVLL